MKKIYLVLSLILIGSVSGFAQGDDCATAAVVQGSGYYSADGPLQGVGGGNISGCGVFGGTNADWYKFTPVCDGVMSITNNIPANPFPNIRLTVRSGTCAALSCVANSGAGGANGTINNISVTGGTTYFLEWDDSWNGTINSGSPFDWTLDFTVNNAPTPSVSAQITTAFLTWIPFGNEPGWDIQWGPSGFNLGSGNNINVDSSAGISTMLSGLTPETTYDYYISIEGTGCWVGPITFTTQPLCPSPTAVTVSPTNTSAILSWQPGGGTIPPNSPTYDLQYGPSGTPIGDPAMLYDNNIASSAHNATPLTSCTNYHMYVREICDANSNPPLVSLWVGPVDITTGCVCPDPSDLAATPSVTNPFEVDVDWTAGGSETTWNIQWGPTGFVFGTGTDAVANSNPYTLSGVTPDSDLDYYLQADCGNGDLSGWVGPFTFTTGVFCPNPTGLGANTITTISANVFWNVSGTTTDYTLEYGAPGFTLGTGTIHTLTSTTASLNNLTPDTEYCYYVQSNCGSTADSSSGWAGPYCFTTLAACPTPNNLSILNLSTTSVTLNWQPGASESEWDVEWGFPGFLPGNGDEQGMGTSNAGSDFYATGLNAAAPYCFYVRAVCGGLDGNSNWAGPFCFTTILSNDLPCGAIELLVDGAVNVHTNVGSTVNGENAIQPPFTNVLATHATNATWWEDTWFDNNNVEAPVWFNFKAPASGKVEVSTEHPITISEETFTEIAIYEVGNCNIMGNFNLVGANSFSNLNSINPALTGTIFTTNTAIAGSRVLLCDLNPGQYYYILVDIVSDNQIAKYDPGTFGISVTDIPAPNAGVATPLTICSDGSSVDLFDAIVDESTTTGNWYNPNAVNPGFTTPGSSPNVSFPAGSGVYTFDYVIANACGVDTVSTSITTVAGPNAGMDSWFTTCNTTDIHLVNHLQGQADLGGSWSDVNGQFTNDVAQDGTFSAYGVQYGTYSFYYIVAGTGNGICPADTAIISINLNDNCLGLDENANSTLEIYPNPVNDVLTIANLSIEGNATVVVYDAQGKMIISQDVSNHAGNFTIDMSTLEAGMYVVEVNAETSTEKVRVIKQ